MSPIKALFILALGLAAVLSPGAADAQTATGAVPSRTGHTACVWARLPQALRTSLMQYADTPADLGEEIEPYADAYAAAATACGLKRDLQIEPLRAFAAMRDIESEFFHGANPDVVERAFLALPEDARNRIAHDGLTRPYDLNRFSPELMAAREANHGLAGPRVDDLWVNGYFDEVAKLTFWERHIVLQGGDYSGAMACIYDLLPIDLQRAAYNAAGEEEPVIPVFAAQPRPLAYASQLCLVNTVTPIAMGEYAKLRFMLRQVSLPRERQWADVDRAMGGLSEADATRLARIPPSPDAVPAADQAFLDATVTQVMHTVGGLGTAPDSPVRDQVRTYMIARAHVNLIEGVR